MMMATVIQDIKGEDERVRLGMVSHSDYHRPLLTEGLMGCLTRSERCGSITHLTLASHNTEQLPTHQIKSP